MDNEVVGGDGGGVIPLFSSKAKRCPLAWSHWSSVRSDSVGSVYSHVVGLRSESGPSFIVGNVDDGVAVGRPGTPVWEDICKNEQSRSVEDFGCGFVFGTEDKSA